MSNVQKILDQFGAQVTKLAKINVGASRNPNGGKKIDTTGRLRKSIKHDVKDEVLSISMEDYGRLRDAGQLGSNKKILKGWNKSIFLPRGKGFTNRQPPSLAIQKWIAQKPIRARAEGGSFTKSGGKDKPRANANQRALEMASLSFLISRKIKKEGIVPGLFLSDAWNKEFKNLPDEILEGLSLDIDEQLE